MDKISANMLRPGVRLSKDIYTFDGKLLLAKDTVLIQSHLDSFRRMGVDYVFTFDPEDDTKQKHFEESYEESLGIVRSCFVEAKLGGAIEHKEVAQASDMLFDQAALKVDLFRKLRMMQGTDDYFNVHSVNVATLSILIGRWMKMPEESIKVLGTAGLLHDIGKMNIPDEILNKPGKLVDSEWEVVKKHPVEGYQMLSGNEWLTPEIGNAILMHHERLDGSGYPMGLRGDSISLYARILAVADVYDAVTSNRVYAAKVSPYRAAEILMEESFGRLDPRIVKVFFDKSITFYVGNRVELSNGEIGTVVYVNPSMPTRPVVQVDETYYDLSRDNSIAIKEVVD